jgi:hypothetical protein
VPMEGPRQEGVEAQRFAFHMVERTTGDVPSERYTQDRKLFYH